MLIFLFGAAGLHAQELDRPIRPVHLSGNWGTNPEAVRLWEEDRTRALVPLKFVEYLRGVHVDWVGLSVGLHIEGSMDSTVERSYSPDLDVPTFTDDALRQIMREFRAHGFDVYLTLAIESFQNLTDTAAEHPMKRMQLGDPGDAEAGVPLDHVYCPECAWPIRPEFWPWRPSHPGHERFVAEFWESYTQQAVHFARMAQEEGVRMYSLGTETDRLFRTRSDGHYWVNDFRRELRTLVERVRAVYSGLLTYDMGNKAFTDEFFEAGSRQLWADLDLDVIGASAWFPLTDSRPSEVLSVESLRREYDRLFRDHLIPVAALNPGLPMVFLEYATTDTVESPANPAAYPENGMVVFSDTNGNGLDDGQEVQDNMYRALFETMEAHPGLVYGAFFWDTWIIASEGAWTGPLMYRTYSFRGKLSEETVREWYDRFGSTLWRLPENLYVSRSGTVAIAIPFAGPVHASSSAPHVATVSVSGSRVTVTPVSEGGAVITVTLAGRTQRFMVRVLPVEPAHSMRRPDGGGGHADRRGLARLGALGQVGRQRGRGAAPSFDHRPLHVAGYVRMDPGSAPAVKQHLAAIRMLGDWLVVRQVFPVNLAPAVRGPKHVVTKGSTPVLSPAEARRLLEAIDTGTLAGRRDRSLVSVMLYSFARVSAVLGMRRQDYFRQGSRGWLRLHEKGGKRHDVPAHHRAAAALDDYLEAAELDEAKAALFQSVDPAGRRLTGRRCRGVSSWP